MSVFIDLNSEKKYVVLFGSNSLKMPELVDMNAEKGMQYYLVVTL